MYVYLFDQVKATDVYLNLHYQAGDFLRHDPAKNHGRLFKEIVNNSFSLYVVYLEVFFRVYFNSLKEITQIMLANYFADGETSLRRLAKKKRMTLIRLYCSKGKKNLRYLNASIDPQTFEYVFLTYKPGVDYSDDHFRLINNL